MPNPHTFTGDPNIPIAMFGLLPIEGSWFLRFEKLLKEFFLKSPRPSLPLKRGIFRKPTRPPLPLREAPPLTPTLSPSGEREETALLGARNRYALRLADHQRSRQIVRDGTAWVLLACGLLMGLVPLLPLLLILILT